MEPLNDADSQKSALIPASSSAPLSPSDPSLFHWTEWLLGFKNRNMFEQVSVMKRNGTYVFVCLFVCLFVCVCVCVCVPVVCFNADWHCESGTKAALSGPAITTTPITRSD